MAFTTIRSQPGNVSNKGEVVGKITDSADYSLLTRLPPKGGGALRVEVTGATAIEIEEWLGRLQSFVFYTILNENEAGWRAKMEIDPATVAATGMDNTFKLLIKNYILDETQHPNWEAIFFDQSGTHLTCDIAKDQTADLPEIKQDIDGFFCDRLEETLHFQQFYFPDSLVNPAVVQGLIDEPLNELPNGDLPPTWTHSQITKAQALANIQDRLV